MRAQTNKEIIKEIQNYQSGELFLMKCRIKDVGNFKYICLYKRLNPNHLYLEYIHLLTLEDTHLYLGIDTDDEKIAISKISIEEALKTKEFKIFYQETIITKIGLTSPFLEVRELTKKALNEKTRTT